MRVVIGAGVRVIIVVGVRVSGINAEESNKVINNPGHIFDGLVNFRLLKWVSDVNPPSKRKHYNEKTVFPAIRERVPTLFCRVFVSFPREWPAPGASPPWLNGLPPSYPSSFEILDGLDGG